MRLTRFHYRALCAALLILAFFVPAYDQGSAFGFVWTSIRAVNTDAELTMLDLVILLMPLLLIPVAALFILLRSVKRQSISTMLLSLPFFALAFFILMLSFDMSRQVTAGNALGLLRQMGIGFYLAVGASALLLLTHSRREALNLSSRRR